MKYVIAHKDGGFLFQPHTRWERTKRLEDAAFMDYEKAQNVLKNAISPVMRPYWSIISEDEAYASLAGSIKIDATAAGDFDWKQISETQKELFSNLKRYGEQLTNELSQVDLEICDIQHYIEFFSLDAARGYKAYKMLKARLIRRREIKDEMAKTNCMLSGNPTDYSSGKITKQIEGLDRRSYTPRVLSELFDLDCRGRYSMRDNNTGAA